MLDRPFPELNTWVTYFSQAELPVLKHTAHQLAQLRTDEETVSGRAIASVVLQDPLMTLRVLAYIEAHRGRSQTADITTIDRAIMMLGIAPFFRSFERLVTVEDRLQHHPQALLGLLRVVARTRRAIQFARDWAAFRHDADIEEITVATLLHDIAEILLWCFAPALALRMKETQAQTPGMRSSAAQRSVLGITLQDLQLALARDWHLPALLVTLMDDEHADHPRVRNVVCAVNLARHSANGWDDPALPDDYAGIEKLLHIGHDTFMARLARLTGQEFVNRTLAADSQLQ